MGASCHGMPMSQAMGAKKNPRIASSECGKGMWCAAEAVVRAAEDAVEQRDEREEADEHDADVEGEASAIDGAAGDGSDEVLVLVLCVFGDVDDAFGGGLLGFRHQHFGDEDGAGRGHDDGGEQDAGRDAVERCTRP